MSTGSITQNNVKIRNLNRFAALAQLGEVVFHTDDLANLWRITNKNTLYTTIKRYVAQGLLFRIHKGFYALKNPKDIDPLLLGVKATSPLSPERTKWQLFVLGVFRCM